MSTRRRRRRSGEDFRREIDAHIALETERLMAEGVPAEEARDRAIRRFGNVTAVRERFTESRRGWWVDRLGQDLQYGVRGLRQSPAFSTVAILTLAIGIGATNAVATQINTVFFATAPVADAASVRMLSWTSTQRAFALPLFRGPRWGARHIDTFPHAVYGDVRQGVTSFAGAACWRGATEALTDSGPVRVHAVSGSFFPTLGVNAVLGRTLSDDDDRAGAPLVAMARDAGLLDRTIRIHGHEFTVVGIVPGDFSGLNPLAPVDLFVPYAADHLFPTFQRNTWGECHIVARLKRGASWEQARAETEVLLQQIVVANPPREAYELPRVHVDDLSMRLADVQRNVTTPLRLMASTVGILLLITCANIGGLLFARGRARQRELATRMALGGTRRLIVQQLLTESLLLCVAGGAAGIALAYALSPLLPRLLSALGNTTALGLTLRPDLRVLLFAVLVSGCCGILFGFLPALRVTRVDPLLTLKQASGVAPPSRAKAGKAALAVQLALAMVVMIGAGLLIRTMLNLRAVPLGYNPHGLVFVETNNPVGRPRAFVDETLAALQTLPGVTAATVSQWPIFNNTTLRVGICVPGPEPLQQLDLSFVFPRFFETWGVRMVMGRDFDDGAPPALIVNETFVRRFLAGRHPLETTLGSGGCPGRAQLPIIGVVADHIDRQRVELVPAVYARYPRAGALYVTTYAVRTTGDERALIPAVRRVIAARGIAPVGDVRTGIAYRDGMTRQERLLTLLFVIFGMTALFISCLGVYGMLAYTVSWRTSEIGLRMAMGARRPDVMWMIVRESVAPVAAGLAAGLGLAIVLGHSIESVLFGVSTDDPVTAAAAAAVLVAAAGIASWLPARRACRIDPLPALRCE